MKKQLQVENFEKYVCPKCNNNLSKLEGHLFCLNCNEKFPIKSNMPDFLSCEKTLKSQEYNIGFNLKHLYKTSKNLETRIKFFNTRLKYNINCDAITNNLNNHFSSCLEVGCGTMQPLLPIGNRYNKNQTIFGIDISLPLLLRAKNNSPRTKLCRGDASSLPFIDSSFDIIWARHMLYHTENPASVIKECKRCLKKEGVFCLSTNSRLNKPEMHEMHNRILKQLSISDEPYSRGSERFPSENAKISSELYFKHVYEYKYEAFFEFNSTNEFIDYYVSTIYFKKLLEHGLKKEQIIECAIDIVNSNNSLKLSNNGCLIFATDSSHTFAEIDKLKV